jgi:alpha-tubulin suppressor-like RCC1 family protein
VTHKKRSNPLVPFMIYTALAILILPVFQNCAGKVPIDETGAYFASVPGQNNLRIRFSAGGHNTCMIKNKRTYCWGNNDYGQLGDGTKVSKSTPTPVLTNLEFISISVGTNHVCAVDIDNVPYCWGNNNYGQLGDGTTGESLQPRRVSGLDRISNPSGLQTIKAGHNFTCAIKSENTAVFCWGNNQSGQLGNMSVANFSTVPVSTGLQNILDLAIASGQPSDSPELGRGCAVTKSLSLYCWGANYIPLENNAYKIDKYLTPRSIIEIWGAKFIDISLRHACVTKSSGHIQCWGFNDFGQLGYQTATTVVKAAGNVAGVNNMVRVLVGDSYSCGAQRTGILQCWGNNTYNDGVTTFLSGQTGVDPNVADKVLAARPLNKTQIAAIDSGHSHTCINVNDKALYCFGNNREGQLGNSLQDYSYTPVLVPGSDAADMESP